MESVKIRIKNLIKGDSLYIGGKDWVSRVMYRSDSWNDEIYMEKLLYREIKEDIPHLDVYIEKGEPFCVRINNLNYVNFDYRAIAHSDTVITPTRVVDRFYDL